MTIHFSNSNQKYPNDAFFVLKFGIFILARNYEVRKIPGHWFLLWQKYC